MNTLDYPQVNLLGFKQASSSCSSHNNPYFSKWWILVLLLHLSVVGLLTYVLVQKNFQLSLLNKNFNFVTLVRVVSMLLVKMIVLALISLTRIPLHLL